MGSLKNTSKTLMKALNTKGLIITYGSKEFMGREGIMHNYNTIYQSHWNPEKNRYDSVAIYSSPSLVRICLYLRDFWCIVNDEELPTDQEKWNKIRLELQEEGNVIYNGKYRT